MLFKSDVIADQKYLGVWKEAKGGHYLWSGVGWKNFESKWKELGKKNLRLIDIDTYVEDGKRKYSGVWRAGSDGYYLWAGVSWKDFENKWKELGKKNLRLIDIETYTQAGKRKYIGVWRGGKDGYYLWSGVSWKDFENKWKELGKKNLRLIDIETYTQGGKRKYIGVWRSGKDGYYLWAGVSWSNFTKKWKELTKQNLRLIDIETYVSKGKRKYTGVWRSGKGGHYLWAGVDWENFTAKWNELSKKSLRLIDMDMYPGCKSKCMNQVVADKSYIYTITGGDTYRWPVDSSGSKKYVRLSAISKMDKFLTLPFNDKKVKRSGIWRYKNGGYHHAGDYSKGAKTFKVRASAPGKVIQVGWDNWSGNSIVISHDIGNKKDAYRTIYMHLRDGKDNDCALAWSRSIPNLSDKNLTDYTTHLNDTGCKKKVSDREPDPSHWGKNSEAISNSLLNKTVKRGEFIAWAGNTGPGGKRGAGGPNTHLHIFWAKKDTDGKWYFFDPYGVYAMPDCYPSSVTGSLSKSCVRYPIAWKNSKPEYP
ncbi:hypothetical protein [Kangiella sp. TOML190]|uniref:hypothetical protein n=1 Tax=Kangiella sp. TOML190 TaxID=2931351 RepID=UPI0020425FB7|nr:hypothetical protein [Kangiella sp. TOML190]